MGRHAVRFRAVEPSAREDSLDVGLKPERARHAPETRLPIPLPQDPILTAKEEVRHPVRPSPPPSGKTSSAPSAEDRAAELSQTRSGVSHSLPNRATRCGTAGAG